MIPRIHQTSSTQSLYLQFLEALKRTDFEGDIAPDYASRTVLATDNSIYQVLPQGVVYPKSIDDLTRITELACQPQYHVVVLSPRGGGTGTNGLSGDGGPALSAELNAPLATAVDGPGKQQRSLR